MSGLSLRVRILCLVLAYLVANKSFFLENILVLLRIGGGLSE